MDLILSYSPLYITPHLKHHQHDFRIHLLNVCVALVPELEVQCVPTVCQCSDGQSRLSRCFTI